MYRVTYQNYFETSARCSKYSKVADQASACECCIPGKWSVFFPTDLTSFDQLTDCLHSVGRGTVRGEARHYTATKNAKVTYFMKAVRP